MRMELNSWIVASIDLSIRRFASARKSSIAAIGPPSSYAGVEMIVPTRSPAATRRMLPSASSNT